MNNSGPGISAREAVPKKKEIVQQPKLETGVELTVKPPENQLFATILIPQINGRFLINFADAKNPSFINLSKQDLAITSEIQLYPLSELFPEKPDVQDSNLSLELSLQPDGTVLTKLVDSLVESNEPASKEFNLSLLGSDEGMIYRHIITLPDNSIKYVDLPLHHRSETHLQGEIKKIREALSQHGMYVTFEAHVDEITREATLIDFRVVAEERSDKIKPGIVNKGLIELPVKITNIESYSILENGDKGYLSLDKLPAELDVGIDDVFKIVNTDNQILLIKDGISFAEIQKGSTIDYLDLKISYTSDGEFVIQNIGAGDVVVLPNEN